MIILKMKIRSATAVVPRTIAGSFAYTGTDILPACRFLLVTAATSVSRNKVGPLFPRILIILRYGACSAALGGVGEAPARQERIARRRLSSTGIKRMRWVICKISEKKQEEEGGKEW